MANRFIITINPTELVPKNSARIYYYFAFWLSVAQSIVIALVWRYLPSVVPLYFTVPWGEARLAPKQYLVILPAISIISMLVNLILGKRAKDESNLLPYSLAVASLIVVVMSIVSLWGILQSIL